MAAGHAKENYSRPNFVKAGQKESLQKSSSNLWEQFFKTDRKLSLKLSICSNASDKNFGKRLLRMFLMLLEVSGHGIPWLAVTAYYAFTLTGQLKEFNCNLLVALLLDLLVVGLVKVAVRRKRPDNNVDDMVATVQVDKFSFPSGHTTRGVLVTLLFTRFIADSLAVVLIYIWAVILAFSRVMLGRHHISDVVAGVLFGYFEASIAYNFLWLDIDSLNFISKTLTSFIKSNL